MSFAGKYGSDPEAPKPKGKAPKSKKRKKGQRPGQSSDTMQMRGANQRQMPAKKGMPFQPSDSLVSMRAC